MLKEYIINDSNVSVIMTTAKISWLDYVYNAKLITVYRHINQMRPKKKKKMFVCPFSNPKFWKIWVAFLFFFFDIQFYIL